MDMVYRMALAWAPAVPALMIGVALGMLIMNHIVWKEDLEGRKRVQMLLNTLEHDVRVLQQQCEGNTTPPPHHPALIVVFFQNIRAAIWQKPRVEPWRLLERIIPHIEAEHLLKLLLTHEAPVLALVDKMFSKAGAKEQKRHEGDAGRRAEQV
jgi:hypothetical protein